MPIRNQFDSRTIDENTRKEITTMMQRTVLRCRKRSSLFLRVNACGFSCHGLFLHADERFSCWLVFIRLLSFEDLGSLQIFSNKGVGKVSAHVMPHLRIRCFLEYYTKITQVSVLLLNCGTKYRV